MKTLPNCLDIISAQTKAFERNDYCAVADTWAVPTTIHVLSRTMVMNNRNEIMDMLRAFKANLAVEGYARTELEVMHLEQSDQGICRSILRWTNFNDRNAPINTMDGSVFVRETDEGHRIELIEIVCESAHNLAAGLPLH